MRIKLVAWIITELVAFTIAASFLHITIGPFEAVGLWIMIMIAAIIYPFMNWAK